MSWQKLGKIFSPSSHGDWMATHASTPYAKVIDENLIRVYFNTRDKWNRSHIAYFDLEIRTLKITDISQEPVLSPGERGLFDDSGVSMGCIVNFNGNEYLYYVGWNLKITVPWTNTIGLAVLDNESGNFVKYSRVPIMDRSEFDPFSMSYPFVLEDSGKLRMWYGSNISWGEKPRDMIHVIRTAESIDGINWLRSDQVSVNVDLNSEYALARPVVLRNKEGYMMWFGIRKHSNAYQIGFSRSRDGVQWVRHDEFGGMIPSAQGWDEEMVCYPTVFEHQGSRYMLYNGNGFGRTGIGLAVWED